VNAAPDAFSFAQQPQARGDCNAAATYVSPRRTDSGPLPVSRSPVVNSTPLVSVVAIFLNAERFLDEAIQSVFAQKYGHWELLLVDDGSSDGSSAIARRYAEQEPHRVRYVDHLGHSNRGMSASRNLGLQHARGEYLALLDADDVWLPEKLERQVAILETHPEVALLFGAPLYWFGWTGRPEDVKRDYVIDLRLPTDRAYHPPALLLSFLRGLAPPPCPSDVLMRRAAVLSVGGFEDRFTGMYEDQAFFSKLLLHAPAFAAGQTWDRYRQHPDSCYAVSKASGRREAARHYYLKWFQQYLREQSAAAGPVWQAVCAELRPFSFARRTIRHARHAAGVLLTPAWQLARATLPAGLRSWVAARLPGLGASPASGPVRFGTLRRLTPVSRRFGWDRGGLPVDRYYIERFLQQHAGDISGRVLEVRDDAYTRRFGGVNVTRSDVLHPTPDNEKATIVADLTSADHIPSNTFDCIVLTQVLPFILDVPAALRTLHRILRPGGVVLASVPGISQIVRYDMDRWGDYWRFTSLSARRLFECGFPEGEVRVEAHGNVLAATAFLQGLSSRDLRPDELDYTDPDYEVLITVRAMKHA
jgi:glycosyltransferase involved in cell wall biosynthesis/SAM-dependent methyltransferase